LDSLQIRTPLFANCLHAAPLLGFKRHHRHPDEGGICQPLAPPSSRLALQGTSLHLAEIPSTFTLRHVGIPWYSI